MQAYLYTWNPSKWHWVDLAYAISTVNSGGLYRRQWSCGRSRKPEPGDLFFLMKLGVDPSGNPKGIVGCGHIVSSPELIDHWDTAKRRIGSYVLSTSLAFVAVSDRPLVSLDELVGRFPTQNWTPQQSGISVSIDIAETLYVELAGSSPFEQGVKS